MPSPQQVAWARFRVTMVIICGLSILSVLFYLLTGGTIFAAKASLFVYVPDATGIAAGSPVRVNGIDIGKVRAVGLSGSSEPTRVVRVELLVQLEHLRSIPVDSYVQVSADTMIGDQFIDISSGRQRAFVAPGAEIRFQPQTDIMKNLDLSQFRAQLQVLDKQLTEIEGGKGRMGEFIANGRLYEETRTRLAEIEDAMSAAVRVTGDVGRVLYSDDLYRKLSAPVEELDLMLAKLQSGQGEVGRLLRDSGAYDQWREEAARLRQTLIELRTTGSTADLLTKDQMYTDLNRMVASWIDAVDRFNTVPALASSNTYESLDGAAREMRDFMHDLRTSPKKYLRIKLF
jgi:phospholipid/cholesterol/gamma-HCH transport system substrate-binding protein